MRALLAWIFLAFASAAPAAEKTILIYGDSLSAAYGIAQARGWPTLLAARLEREHRQFKVANASLSGETTGGGLARFGKGLEQRQPGVVVPERRATDGL